MLVSGDFIVPIKKWPNFETACYRKIGEVRTSTVSLCVSRVIVNYPASQRFNEGNVPKLQWRVSLCVLLFSDLLEPNSFPERLAGVGYWVVDIPLSSDHTPGINSSVTKGKSGRRGHPLVELTYLQPKGLILDTHICTQHA